MLDGAVLVLCGVGGVQVRKNIREGGVTIKYLESDADRESADETLQCALRCICE